MQSLWQALNAVYTVLPLSWLAMRVCTQHAALLAMGQVREANQMVEEMMLLANVTVAEHVLDAFPACALLRRHPVPPPRQFEPLLRAAAAAARRHRHLVLQGAGSSSAVLVHVSLSGCLQCIVACSSHQLADAVLSAASL